MVKNGVTNNGKVLFSEFLLERYWPTVAPSLAESWVDIPKRHVGE